MADEAHAQEEKYIKNENKNNTVKEMRGVVGRQESSTNFWKMNEC